METRRILDSLSIPIKFLIQKSYRNQVCRTAPRSRITYTNFRMETRRHFGFPNDTNQVPHTKVVLKPSLSYSPHAHVQPIQTFVWKPVTILDSLSIPIKFPIQKSYRNQVCHAAPTPRYGLYKLLYGNPLPF